jgi:hypothetical protein
MNLPAVLKYLNPTAEWSLNGDDYNGLEWYGPGVKPTETECEAAWPEVQRAQAKKEAQANRHQAFTVEADPLFFKWQRGEGTEQAWLDKVAEIRNRYPDIEAP